LFSLGKVNVSILVNGIENCLRKYFSSVKFPVRLQLISASFESVIIIIWRVACISKSGKVTYYIRAFDDYDSQGEQIVRSMTWKPSENLTPKQIEKELQRQVIMFEETVKKGTCFDCNTRFSEYAEIRLENNKPPILAPKGSGRSQSSKMPNL